MNVDAGQTAYINVVTQEKATGADHADCRVFAAIATPSDLSAMAPKLAK